MWTIKQEKKLHEKIINEIGSEVNSELVKIEKTLFLNKRDKTMNLQKLIKMHILSKFPLLEEYKDYNKNELSQLRKISPSLIEKIGIESFKYKKMSKDLENNIRKRYSIIGNNLINYFIDFESNLDFFIYKNANKGFTTETLKDMHQKRKQEIFEIEKEKNKKKKEWENEKKINDENRIQEYRERFFKLIEMKNRPYYCLYDNEKIELANLGKYLESIGRIKY
jgi:hypothetical protein